MATKMKLEISGINELMQRIDKLGGDSKEIAEKALRETHRIVTEQAEAAMDKGNLPAKGKYSTGETLKSLIRTPNISWNGSVASVDVGFRISGGDFTSILLIYGTPKMKKDQKLYNAFYSKRIRDEIRKAQEDVLYEEVRRLEHG